MAARRLMIILMALIAVSMAITVIAQPLRNRFGPPGTASTTTSAIPPKSAKPDRAEMAQPGPERAEITATMTPVTNRIVRIAVDDRLTLFVKVIEPTEVAIPGMGLSAYADPYAPARFDILARRPGRFMVRTASGQRLGVIDATERSLAGSR